jgi:hypothetical protein
MTKDNNDHQQPTPKAANLGKHRSGLVPAGSVPGGRSLPDPSKATSKSGPRPRL